MDRMGMGVINCMEENRGVGPRKEKGEWEEEILVGLPAATGLSIVTKEEM